MISLNRKTGLPIIESSVDEENTKLKLDKQNVKDNENDKRIQTEEDGVDQIRGQLHILKHDQIFHNIKNFEYYSKSRRSKIKT